MKPQTVELEMSDFLYELRGKKGRIKDSLTYELIHGAPDLEKVRNLLTSGKLAEANQSIEYNLKRADSAFEKGEYLLEAARLCLYDGLYGHSIEFATRAAETTPYPLTRLSAYQVRGTCAFEIGDIVAASSDLERAELMGRRFPDAPVNLNVKALRTRVLVRRKDFARAWALISEWGAELHKKPSLALTQLHQFERIRLDVLRFFGRDFLNSALRTYFYSTATHEAMFRSCAMLDIWTALPEPERNRNSWLLQGLEEFPRLKNLIDDGLSEQPRTETGRNIANSLGTRPGNPPNWAKLAVEEIPNAIIDKDFQFYCCLQSERVISLKDTPQIFHGLIALAGGPLTKSDFFRRVWGLAYNPGNPESAVRALLARIRRQTGCEIESKDGFVSIASRVLVLGDSETEA